MSRSRLRLRALVVALLAACGACSELPAPGNYGTTSGEADESTGAEAICPGTGPASASDCVERARYVADLEAVAKPRAHGTPHWQAVQDLCADRLAELGFDVERQDFALGTNVIGRQTGTTEPDQQIVIGAHYDGPGACPGADDNASGVAGVLEAARVLAGRTYDRTLVVACWDQEEVGLAGSSAFATGAAARGEAIVVCFNFEMIGYADATPHSQEVPAGLDLLFPEAYEQVVADELRGDFIALVGDTEARAALAAIAVDGARTGLKTVSLELDTAAGQTEFLLDLRRSDHASFWDQGYPAIMITDTANFRNPNYHCFGGTQDVVETLDHDFATGVVAATVAAATEMLDG